MKRAYLDGDDISQAIFNSGLKLRTADLLGTNLLGTKLDAIARELTDKMRARVCAELQEFEEKVLF